MPNYITKYADLPDYAKPTARRIEEHGFQKWFYEDRGPVYTPAQLDRLQIRSLAIAPPSEVAKYADCMRRGDKFPPCIVTKDRILDGNTRYGAAHKLKWPDFPVFMLDVPFEGASPSMQQRLFLLAAASNTHGAKPLSNQEIADIIKRCGLFQNQEWTAESVAAKLGLQSSVVQKIYAQFRAEERSKRLGIPLDDNYIPPSIKTLLGQRSPKLNDFPFKEIVELVRDAGLRNTELAELMTRVQKANGSDADKVAIIKQEREARAAQIDNLNISGRRYRLLSSDLRPHLRWILNHAERVPELVDYNRATASEQRKLLEDCILVLQQVVQAQSGVETD